MPATRLPISATDDGFGSDSIIRSAADVAFSEMKRPGSVFDDRLGTGDSDCGGRGEVSGSGVETPFVRRCDGVEATSDCAMTGAKADDRVRVKEPINPVSSLWRDANGF